MTALARLRSRALVALALIVATTFVAVARPSQPAVAASTPAAGLQEVLRYLADAGERWGVQLTGISVTDLRNGAHAEANGQRQMSYMSSAKFPWAAMAVAESGITAVEPDVYALFHDSDNGAAGHMIDLAGGIDRVDDYWYPALGMTRTCTQRWNYEIERVANKNCGYPTEAPFDIANGHTFWNYSTADDMTGFLEKLWAGELPGLDASEASKVLEWAGLSEDEWSPDGDGTMTGYMPPATWRSVAHKIGWFFEPYLSASDIGIVNLPQTTYALSIASYGGNSSAAQADYLAWASCEVYRAMSGDLNWDCTQRNYANTAGSLALDVMWAPPGEATFRAANAGAPVLVDGDTFEARISITAAGSPVGGIQITSSAPACNRLVTVERPGETVTYTCTVTLAHAVSPTSVTWAAAGLSSGSVVSAALEQVNVQVMAPSFVPTWQVQAGYGGAWAEAGTVTQQADADPRWRLTLANNGNTTLKFTVALTSSGLDHLACTDDDPPSALRVDLVPGARREILCVGAIGASGVAELRGQLGGSAAINGFPERVLPTRDLAGLSASEAASQRIVTQTPSTFLAVSPTRILDTRNAGGQALPRGTSRTVNVPLTALPPGVARGAVTAVAINLTAVNAAGDGWLTLHATDRLPPLASNVNYTANTVAPNMAVVAIDQTGQFAIFASETTDLVIDLVGLFVDPIAVPESFGFQSLPPKRVLDTRELAQGRPLTPGPSGLATQTVAVRGAGLAVPATAKAVVVTLTSTGATAPGWLALHGENKWPGTSNLNVATADTRANTAITAIGADGSIRVTTSTTNHVIIDVLGYFDGESNGLRFVPLANQRLADSRWSKAGAIPAGGSRSAAITATSPTAVPSAASVSLPWPVRAAWVNSTVTGASSAGWFLLWSGAGAKPPLASTQNFAAGQTRANAVPVRLADNATNTSLALAAGTTGPSHWTLDLAGVFVDVR